MEKHVVRVLETSYVTHNVKHFAVEKPEGYTYTPGQATDVSIDKPGQEEELRPFTFVSHTADHYLEFTIKIYKDHNGVTNKLGDINPGDELILHEVFGAITYQRPGVFIAGGAGVTPFIAILRQLQDEGKLAGNTLLLANHTAEDVILKDELSAMLGDNLVNVISGGEAPGMVKGRIDSDFLRKYIKPGAFYYVCGPEEFTKQMIDDLKKLDVAEDKIVMEK